MMYMPVTPVSDGAFARHQFAAGGFSLGSGQY
jgi:hypothetical protein